MNTKKKITKITKTKTQMNAHNIILDPTLKTKKIVKKTITCQIIIIMMMLLITTQKSITLKKCLIFKTLKMHWSISALRFASRESLRTMNQDNSYWAFWILELQETSL